MAFELFRSNVRPFCGNRSLHQPDQADQGERNYGGRIFVQLMLQLAITQTSDATRRLSGLQSLDLAGWPISNAAWGTQSCSFTATRPPRSYGDVSCRTSRPPAAG
jgi:hypothetical protein